MITILTVALVALFSVSSPSTAPEAEPKQKTAEEQQEEEKPPRVYWDNGLWFRARRANFRLKIGGQAQNDTAAFASGGSQPVELDGGVEWRRVRAYSLGSFAQRWSFKFQWDFFTTGRSPSLTDAWIERRKNHLMINARTANDNPKTLPCRSPGNTFPCR